MIQHILFPSDGSAASQKIEAHVVAMSRSFQARVTVLHAYEFLEAIPVYEASYAYLEELEVYLEAQSKELVEQTRLRLEAQGLTVNQLINKGPVGQSIVQASRDQACDLIVMGSHRRGAVKRLLLGSSSNYVVHHAECPVLLVPVEES
jgi:nucleotide-binding universal stress UspA family protein